MSELRLILEGKGKLLDEESLFIKILRFEEISLNEYYISELLGNLGSSYILSDPDLLKCGDRIIVTISSKRLNSPRSLVIQGNFRIKGDEFDIILQEIQYCLLYCKFGFYPELGRTILGYSKEFPLNCNKYIYIDKDSPLSNIIKEVNRIFRLCNTITFEFEDEYNYGSIFIGLNNIDIEGLMISISIVRCMGGTFIKSLPFSDLNDNVLLGKLLLNYLVSNKKKEDI